MASYSSSSANSSRPWWIYDVFLSFRGENTRKTFVDHLYEALDRKGIYTFKDDIRLPRGESIAPKLLEAIEESRFAIIVFSKDYGDSCWCLDELEKIMKCKKALGQIVLPVFYDVEPSDVRKQIGAFGEAFSKYSTNFKVDIWRKALVEAVSISGWELKNTANGHEAQCIKEIVETISLKLLHINSMVDEILIGIDLRVKKVELSLELGSGDVRMIGIWGMGGAGKTTLARAVFNKLSNHFDGISFVENIREVSQKYGLQNAQLTILSNILMEKYDLNGVHHGKSMISRRLCRKKVLIVLDDVDHLSQLQALAGAHCWFGEGSRIVITTRDEHLLLAHKVNEIIHVNLLNDEEAIQLFSMFTFGTNYPKQEYKTLSLRVVRYANGLPLALKILGSFLCDKGMSEWESALARLQDNPEFEILDVIKLSYDGLKESEKEIFLDIACFFKGWERDMVLKILDCCGFYPDIGVKVLLQKSLLTTSNEMFEMHDLIQEMGRHIVRGQHPKHPEKHSRVWQTEELVKICRDDAKAGNEAIEALVETATKEPAAIVEKNNWYRVNFTKSFMNMKKLRMLHVTSLGHEGPDYLPDELRWLHWLGYPSKCLPATFQAENLVGIKIPCSFLVQLWEGYKVLPKLKFLDLNRSYHLITTPDFTGIPNLERLELQNCEELVEIHPSIGFLERLVYVNLYGCGKLKTFPTIVSMKSLETLIFTNCREFTKFPEIQGLMDRMTKLYLDGTAIRELPSSIRKFTGLMSIHLDNCKTLTSLPSTLSMLRCLKILTLRGCSNLDTLPENLGQMDCLEELLLDGTRISQLPSSIVLLKSLKTLSLNTYLDFISEESMVFVMHNLSRLSSLVKLDFSDCNLLEGDIPSDIGMLSSLENLNLTGNHFYWFPSSISQLSRLKVLLLDNCQNLQALPMLPSSIAVLHAKGCFSLRSLDSIPNECEWLWKVSFANCSKCKCC